MMANKLLYIVLLIFIVSCGKKSCDSYLRYNNPNFTNFANDYLSTYSNSDNSDYAVFQNDTETERDCLSVLTVDTTQFQNNWDNKGNFCSECLRREIDLGWSSGTIFDEFRISFVPIGESKNSVCSVYNLRINWFDFFNLKIDDNGNLSSGNDTNFESLGSYSLNGFTFSEAIKLTKISDDKYIILAKDYGIIEFCVNDTQDTLKLIQSDL